MKKNYLLIAFLLVATYSTCFAQKGLEIGLRVFPQATTLVNDDDFAAGDELNFKVPFKFGGGLTVGYNFTNSVGLYTGVLFSPQGTKYVNGDKTLEWEAKLNYIKIPFVVKANSNPNNGVCFLFNAGIEYGILSSATGDYSYWDGVTSSADKDIKDTFKSSALAAMMGFGAQFKFTDQILGHTMLRFDYAFGDIENPDTKTPANRTPTHPGAAGLQIGISYLLGSDN